MVDGMFDASLQAAALVGRILSILHDQQCQHDANPSLPSYTPIDHVHEELWKKKDKVVWNMVRVQLGSAHWGVRIAIP